ncbi:hypothetical protein ACFWMG_10615 [Streptomyces sp. NPDC127074]
MEAGDYRLAADLELKILHHPDGHKMPPFGARSPEQARPHLDSGDELP